jgi:hypothetical protein
LSCSNTIEPVKITRNEAPTLCFTVNSTNINLKIKKKTNFHILFMLTQTKGSHIQTTNKLLKLT